MLPTKKSPVVSFRDVQMYVAVWLKHFRLTVLLMCLPLALGLAFYILKRPVYHAKCLIRVRSDAKPFDMESLFGDSGMIYVLEQIKMPYLVEGAARRLGVDADYDNIMSRHLRKVQFRLDKAVGPFSNERDYYVSVYAMSVEWARGWLPAALDAFEEYREQSRYEQREQEIARQTENMSLLRERMEEFEARVQAFRTENRMDELQAEYEELQTAAMELSAVGQRLRQLDRARQVIGDDGMSVVDRFAQLEALNTGVRAGLGGRTGAYGAGPGLPLALQSGLGSVPQRDAVGPVRPPFPSGAILASALSAPSGAVGPALPDWQQLQDRRLTLEHRRQELGRTFLAGHPKMQELRTEIEAVDEELSLRLRVLETRLGWEYASLTERRNDLELKALLFQKLRPRYEDVMRQYQKLEALRLPWDEAYAEAEETASSLSRALEHAADAPERYDIRYLGVVEGNELPVSPNRGKLFVFCVALALLYGLGVPYVIEYLDHTISMLDKAEETLGMQGLGIVPLVRQEMPGGRRLLLTGASGRHPSATRSLLETFRVLRANIQGNKTFTGNRQVIMVTSSIPKEGKSVVSSNLALTFARTGERTLLIDCDIRRGILGRTFGVKSRPGLSSLLAEQASLDDVCVPSGFSNLDILPSGKHTGSAAELVTSPAFARFMQEVRQRYQRIILDTPPALGLSETCDILPFVDGCLLVVWSSYTPLHQVQATVDLLRNNGASFFGFVLNRLDLSSASNYYYYFYYSNYYYGSYRPVRHLPERTPSPTEA